MAGSSDDVRVKEAFAHCAEIVRGQDPERATAALFAPEAARGPLQALYAFDIETAAIRDKARQPMPGEIRLQWWRDVIASDEAQQASPVAAALLATVDAYDLPRDAFERLLDARTFDLYDDPMPSREAFETYAGETASAVMMMAAMILDRARAPEAAGIAGHAGVLAVALDTLAQEERQRRLGQVFVPGDLLTAVGLDREAWLAGDERAAPARRAMRFYAQEHSAMVEAGWPGLPRSLRPAFLPARLAPARLAAMGRGGAAEASVGPLRRAYTYWRAMRSREEDARR